MLSSIHHTSSQSRGLSIDDQTLTPKLEYTGSGYFPESQIVTVGFADPISHPWTNQTETALTNTEITFYIHNSPVSRLSTGCPGGIIVWLESKDTKSVFAVPAFYAKGPEAISSNSLVVKTRIADPGSYNVHIVGYQSVQHDEGAHGTVGDIRPFLGSPWSLQVVDNDRDESAEIQTKIRVPTRICDTSDLELSGKGRWVECAFANIPREECLYDGWVYLPHNCRYEHYTTLDALENAKMIVESPKRAKDSKSGEAKPIWIVVTGSSIERGTLHAMVDMLGAIGNIDPVTKGVESSVADALFNDIADVRGKGSMTKCWGWYDVQIGNIRLSFQDMRATYIDRDPVFREEILKRFTEIVHEGPDLIVLGDIFEGNYNVVPYNELIDVMASAPEFDGQLVVSPQKQHLKSAGIGSNYLCKTNAENAAIVATSGAQSIAESTRQQINGHLAMCGDTCSHMVDRILVAEENEMSWPFIFNTERPMSDTVFSQHYHAYHKSGVPKPKCGSVHSDRRYVVGSVTEMAAQMYLSTTISRLATETGIETLHKWGCGNYIDRLPHFEKDFATTHPFRACFSCPTIGMVRVGLANSIWKPPFSPPQTLSDRTLNNKEVKFSDGDNEFCYEGPTLY